MATFTSTADTQASAALPSVLQIEEELVARLGDIEGVDTEQRTYDSLTELWEYIHRPAHAQADKKRRKGKAASAGNGEQEGGWYEKAASYWDSEANCPLSDDGVLGGYGKLTPMDARDSNLFLDSLQQLLPELRLDVVADCGAGIGRVSKSLLVPRFQQVHLVEQSARLLAAAPQYIGLSAEEAQQRLVLVEQGLQDFAPAPGTFDVIWIQWVIGHLHDHDFIRFFQRCARGLKEHGVIVLKDNTITDPELTFCLDLQDNSVARHLEYQKILFSFAGLEVIAERAQKDFPEELYPVYMIALRPKKSSS